MATPGGAGPLPLPIEHSASSYGEEGNVQRAISEAVQYNPATKLGITAGDQPSKKALATGQTTEQVIGKSPILSGLGPKSGLEGTTKDFQAPTPKPYAGPHPFTSPDIASHRSHLSRLTNLSPAMKSYLGGK